MRRALVLLAAAMILVAGAGATASPQEFPNPPALQPQVRFWTRVYTEVGTDAALIHDAYLLDVVYERVDFPEALTGREMDARCEPTKQRYREILRRLASGERENLTPEERRVLKLFPEGVSNRTLEIAAESVRLQRGQADRFREGLVRSGAWEGHIERTLERKRLPRELAALPHVESSYNPEAYSKVGAAGLWQFMPSTGRLFSLRVNNVVDERMDPFRATEAAADLLEHNHEMLGTWPLALTAYNHGAGGMARAVRELGTTDFAEIVKRYDGPGFGFASRNFYTSFLAARDASQHAEQYFGPIRKQQPVDYRIVHLGKPFSVRTLKSALGVDLETLRVHNLALRDDFWDGRKTAPAGVTVRVPRGGVPVDALAEARAERWRPQARGEPPGAPAAGTETAAAAAGGAELPAEAPAGRTGTVVHELKGNETIAALARRYGVPASVILGVNHVRDPRSLRPGQRLRIPTLGTPPAAPPAEIVSAPVTPPKAGEPATPPPMTGEPVAPPTAASEPVAPPTAASEAPPAAAESGPLVDALAEMQQQEADELAARPPLPQAAPESELLDEAPLGSPRARSASPATALAARPASPKPRLPSMPDPRQLARDTLDRSRYAVGSKGTITLQTDESLERVAGWLGVKTDRLRSLNRLSRRANPGPGTKLRLDFAKVPIKKFEAHRIAYHQELRNEFFESFEVAGTEQRVVRRGDTVRTLTRGKARVPTWLLNHYNPDVDFGALKPGRRVTIPKVERRDS